ncbi:MAG: VirB4 family type IV secretion system protein [Candidatus Dormibacteria bacterium]
MTSLEGGVATLRTGELRAAIEIDPVNLALQPDSARSQIWRQYRQVLVALGGSVSLHTISRPLSTTDRVPAHGSRVAATDAGFRAGLVQSRRIQSQLHLAVIWGPRGVPTGGRVLRRGVRNGGSGAPGRVGLEHRCQALMGGLARVGLSSRRLDDGDWFSILQSCTGGRSGRQPPDFPSWLAPGLVVLRPRLVEVDRHYCRSLVISSLPRRLTTGWLAPLVLTPPCTLRLTEHIHPVAKLASLAHLRRRIRTFETSLQVDQLRGQRPDRGTEAALGDALELEERVLLEEERLFRLGIAVTLEADSTQELEESWTQVLATLAEMGCGVIPLTHRQADGWRTTLPAGVDPVGWSRDMTGSALATGIPFIRAGLSASDGVLLGPSLVSRELVVVDPFSARNPNFNVIVLGTSGAGKSFTAKLLAARLALHGARLRCLDPAGEYLQLTSLLGGRSTLLGTRPGAGLNALGPPMGSDATMALRRAALVLPVLETLAAGRGANGVLQDSAAERLERAVIQVIERDPERCHLADLVRVLEQAGEDQMAARLTHFTTGVDLGFFDGVGSAGQTQVATISLRNLQRDREHLLAALMQLVLVHLEAELATAAGIPHLLLVDEAEVLLASSRAATALESLTRRLRKLGAGIMVISQVVEDFLTSPVGNVIIRNCHTKVLLRQEEVAIPAVQKAFGLSEVECELLVSADPGCGLVLVGRERAAFAGAAPPDWLGAMSTNALAPALAGAAGEEDSP